MTQENIDIVEIMKMLPHRYPFLLVDKVISIEKGVSAVGIKNVTMNEPQFTGHFPGEPVMPGVLMVEALAQLAGVLSMKSMDSVDDMSEKLMYFMSIESAKFRKIVRPGDVLEMHVKVERQRREIWKFSAYALVDGEKAVEAEFTAMVK